MDETKLISTHTTMSTHFCAKEGYIMPLSFDIVPILRKYSIHTNVSIPYVRRVWAMECIEKQQYDVTWE